MTERPVELAPPYKRTRLAQLSVGRSFRRISVRPGSFLYRIRFEGTRWASYLIVVPTKPNGFEQFCRRATEKAGFDLYTRIRSGEIEGTHHVQDFRGDWMQPFVVKSWSGTRIPDNIQEAVRQHTAAVLKDGRDKNEQ